MYISRCVSQATVAICSQSACWVSPRFRDPVASSPWGQKNGDHSFYPLIYLRVTFVPKIKTNPSVRGPYARLLGRTSHCLIRAEPKIETSSLVVTLDAVPRTICATFIHLGVEGPGSYGIGADTI